MPSSTNVHPLARTVYDYDHVFAAMCIMEEIASPTMSGEPWQPYRDQNGICELRTVVIGQLAGPCDERWNVAYKAFEDGQAPEPGSFDYEFVPFWLRECVDWSDPVNGPRVRGS